MIDYKGQIFTLSYDLAPPPPPLPASQHVVSLTQSFSVSAVPDHTTARNHGPLIQNGTLC
jgi:hypothetical protein